MNKPFAFSTDLWFYCKKQFYKGCYSKIPSITCVVLKTLRAIHLAQLRENIQKAIND